MHKGKGIGPNEGIGTISQRAADRGTFITDLPIYIQDEHAVWSILDERAIIFFAFQKGVLHFFALGNIIEIDDDGFNPRLCKLIAKGTLHPTIETVSMLVTILKGWNIRRILNEFCYRAKDSAHIIRMDEIQWGFIHVVQSLITKQVQGRRAGIFDLSIVPHQSDPIGGIFDQCLEVPFCLADGGLRLFAFRDVDQTAFIEQRRPVLSGYDPDKILRPK